MTTCTDPGCLLCELAATPPLEPRRGVAWRIGWALGAVTTLAVSSLVVAVTIAGLAWAVRTVVSRTFG